MKDLRKWRERKGFSQKEVAISLGVAPPQISKWEAEATEPSLENLIKLSELYDVTLDEIVGHSQPAWALTPEERDLLRIFRQLNPRGRSLVLGNAELVLQSSDYREESTTASAG